MNGALIEAILSYCEMVKREGVEYATIAFSPAGSDALFTCRAARREHAERIGDFAADTLCRSGLNCVMTLDKKDGVWWASVLPVPKEAA